MTDFIYTYPPLIPGILRKRYKRFLADIELESGEIITAHCANTGPMIGVCQLDSPVYVSESNNPQRKLAYTWEMIELDGTWIGINTALPNRVIKQVLEQQKLPPLAEKYTKVRSEVPYGVNKKSRIDFVLTGESEELPIYLEVKNTTLAKDKIAFFPDTVTTRGQKHLQELMDLLPNAKPMMLYFINRGDCDKFSPGDEWDKTYGELFKEAVNKGVEILPCRFEISPEGIRYLGLAELVI
ncbi:DNA/RNA nuclease SfsA [Crocosphaera sp. XPORK-15E]|uniref:DNA/RNA nuclease SfsA n=1 Tax=Crocosphaera sp. XPORK-15E TaxID=3110247 RepID=UPI002B1E9F76|nr:DNA/RNA nuclease SfsA [Crocosphaera sp. XPORK-15E]MEA5534838.1 DNA/RNA nuclease SfsA [Crocosphaera sp. XPORK-15E]